MMKNPPPRLNPLGQNFSYSQKKNKKGDIPKEDFCKDVVSNMITEFIMLKQRLKGRI